MVSIARVIPVLLLQAIERPHDECKQNPCISVLVAVESAISLEMWLYGLVKARLSLSRLWVTCFGYTGPDQQILSLPFLWWPCHLRLEKERKKKEKNGFSTSNRLFPGLLEVTYSREEEIEDQGTFYFESTDNRDSSGYRASSFRLDDHRGA